MPNSSSVASTQLVETTVSTAKLVRRIVIHSVQSVFNCWRHRKLRPVFYRATIHDPLPQTGVTLLFAGLLGSLAKMWFVALTTRPGDNQPPH